MGRRFHCRTMLWPQERAMYRVAPQRHVPPPPTMFAPPCPECGGRAFVYSVHPFLRYCRCGSCAARFKEARAT